jgi:two-component system, sensor histidine kinase and response regulator
MSKTKILVIEDELTLREEICELLRFEGFEVHSADNGAVGLTNAIRHQPDLILCDILMPVMNGNQVLQKLRENETTMLTPFIFMSALADRDNIRHGMKIGADDYLTKPFSRTELLQTIDIRFKKQEVIHAKKEQEMDTLRTNIITRLPHELRSPLSGIIGFGTLLKDMAGSLSTEDVTDIGNEILDSGNRLLRLVENYMVFVQLQLSEPKDETISGGNMVAIMQETTQTIAKIYDRKDNLKLSLASSESVHVSEPFLRKIVHELTDNAFRFSPKESDVSITGTADAEHYTLTISDQGRGFTKEQIGQIGAYMQFDRDKLEQQGSGLGLIISKKMTELSGGTFSIQSEKDNGTAIIMTFAKK